MCSCSFISTGIRAEATLAGMPWNPRAYGAVLRAARTASCPFSRFLQLYCGLYPQAKPAQMIHFGRCQSSVCTDCFLFCGASLPFLDSVFHLDHTLRHDLGDEDDIALRTRDMIRKANCIMRTFQGVDSIAMTHLYHSFCLSLYGSALWNMSCKAFRIVKVAFNNILRRFWGLPAYNSYCNTSLCCWSTEYV